MPDKEKSQRLIKELQNTTEHYQSLIDDSPDGFFIADLSGNLLSVNNTICKRLDYSEKTLLQMNLQQIIDTEYHDQLQLRLARVQKGDSLLEPIEYILLTRDKKRLNVEISSTPLVLRNELIGFQSIIRDISSRREAEEAFRESETAYQHVFNSMLDALVILDNEGTIIESNPSASAMYGYSSDELKGKHATDLIHQDYWHVFSDFKKSARQDGYFKGETIDLKKDGSKINVEVRGSIIIRRKKKYFLILLRDITDRKTNELEKERLISELENKVSQIKTLSGLLPICSSCKNIRDDYGYWNKIENYIQDHSQAEFSHSLCPTCSEKLYGEESWYKNMKNNK